MHYRTLFTFALSWLAVGFVTGTATLVGPVRWIAEHGRDAGWSVGAEAAAVRAVMAAFVCGSAVAAIWLTVLFRSSPHRHVRAALVALSAAATAATVGLWLDPVAMAGRGAAEEAGRRFTFGPYPDEAELRRLVSAGYTGVISLLHPAVVPFETKLIRDEERAARAAGIEFLHVPMLPWVSDNSTALARLTEIAERPEGRFYVHCYLGKDRIRLARAHVERLVGAAGVGATQGVERHVAKRRLVAGLELARGEVVEAGDGVWLIPYPTDDEFMSWILPGLHGPVVSLLDPEAALDRSWIEKERELLASNGVGFTLLPLPVEPLDAARALEVARQVRAMPRPVIVHAFLSPGSGRAPAAEAFLEAFRSDEAPAGAAGGDAGGVLPASLFPAPRTIVLAGPILLLVSGAAASAVGWLRARRSVRTAYTRKLFHFAIFTTASLVHLAAGLPAVMLYGAIVSLLVLYAVWRGPDFAFYEALARPSDAPRRTLFVLVPLLTTALGGLLSNLLFGAAALVGYLVAGWGDAVAEPVGTAWGRHRYRVPSLAGVPATRSLEGSFAVCFVGGLAAAAGLWLAGHEPLAAIGIALVCGAAGALVEAISHHGLDNLTVQLAASGTAFLLLG